jgi:hypothetical protein
MKVHRRSRGIAPPILNLETKGAKLTPRPLNPRDLCPLFFFWKDKNLLPLPEFESRTVQSVALQDENLVGSYDLHLSFHGTEKLQDTVPLTSVRGPSVVFRVLLQSIFIRIAK